MQLKACAAAQRVLDGHPPRADVARGTQIQVGARDAARGLTGPQGAQEPEVAVAQVGAAIGDPAVAVEDPLGIEEAVGVDQVIGA